MNAETAEKEKNQTEETKEEVKASEAPVEKKDENKDEEKAKSVDKNSAAVSNLRLLENIEVKLTVEVGNTEVKICFFLSHFLNNFQFSDLVFLNVLSLSINSHTQANQNLVLNTASECCRATNAKQNNIQI